MKPISRKKRDQAMRLIIDFYSKARMNQHIATDFLVFRGLCDPEEAVSIVRLLSAYGLIQIGDDRFNDSQSLILTEKGWRYFEQQADEKASSRREHRHNWLIAIFTAVAGALLSEPLWSGLRWLISLFSKRP